MNTIKKIYYYFFYIFYKSAKAVSSWLPYDFVAGVIMGTLELWILFSFLSYYNIINNINPTLDPNKITYIVVAGIIVFVINGITFIHYDNIWKEYNKKFDELPKKKNIIGGIIVWTIVIIIFANLFLSTEYMLKKFKIGSYNPEVIAKKRKEDSLQRAKQIENLKKIYGEDKKK
ncbi:MAG: hypothetical protein DI535_29895 [Citrobacter freundii]|nr:MAG: hypothetical protein DI535_29895 [Citrobacter freundii]